MPIGVVLIVIGMAGSASACFNVSMFNGDQTKTTAAQMQGHTDKTSDQADTSSAPRMIYGPLSGLALAVGLVCVGIGMGNWRRPVPSDVRPANPWNDQPGEHGEPPRGLV